MPRLLKTIDESLLFAHPNGPIALFEVTIPVANNQCLMRPDSTCVERINGVIGRAQALFSFELYAYEFLSTHAHLALGVWDLPTKAALLQYVNGNVAREVNRLRERSGAFFGRRNQAIQIADEAAAVDRLRYIMGQATAAQVVAHPRQTPFASANPTLLRGEPIVGVWIDREAMSRAGSTREADYAVAYPVRIDPLPHLRGDPAGYRALCMRLAAEVAAEGLEERKRTGRRLQSAAAARRMDPQARIRPKRVAFDDSGRAVDVRRSPAPCLHGTRAARAAWRQRYAGVREAVCEATASWCAFLGDGCTQPLRYPPGTLPPGALRARIRARTGAG